MMWWMIENFGNEVMEIPDELIQKMNWWAGSEDAGFGEVAKVSVEKKINFAKTKITVKITGSDPAIFP